jgi:hypothetical protein
MLCLACFQVLWLDFQQARFYGIFLASVVGTLAVFLFVNEKQSATFHHNQFGHTVPVKAKVCNRR